MKQDSLSSTDVREKNAKRLLKYIYDHGSVSKQGISHDLAMSLPTVTQNINRWEELGIVEKTGQFESTGGRKAYGYHIASTLKVAIGVSILKEFYHITLVDLYGRTLFSRFFQVSFSKEEEYYQTLVSEMMLMVRTMKLQDEQILGVKIAVQGLVSTDGKQFVYGKILETDQFPLLEMIQQRIKYPCAMIHDTEAAAMAELWAQRDISDAVILYLNRYFGGAVIIHGRIYQGCELPSSILEHMTLYPGGIKCYCGKKGCIESYCSAYALKRNAGEPLDSFFEKLRAGDAGAGKIWEEYLRNLAIAINNMRMLMDTEYIIAGHMLRYILPEDINTLQQFVDAESPFKTRNVKIRMSAYPEDSAAPGAAICLIKAYLDTLLS